MYCLKTINLPDFGLAAIGRSLGIVVFSACFNSWVDAETASQIYQRRIIPLIKSPEPSSCTECHLNGLDLKEFLFEDPKRTFVELRSRGWIDVESPEQSKILKFIAKKTEDATLLQQKVRETEHAAFRSWIEASVHDPDTLSIPIAKRDDLAIDVELVRHARSDQITERFVMAIWSQLERCANCHSPDRNAKHVEKYGNRMSWIAPKSPQKTLNLILTRKLIDLNSPDKSLLRLKAIGDESHGGGIKFPSGGHTDKTWIDFIEDYRRTVNGEYQLAADIPKRSPKWNWRSGMHLRIGDFPAAWADRFLIVTFHRQLDDGSYSTAPTAWAESRVSRDRLSWSNSLSLFSDSSHPFRDSSTGTNLDEAMPMSTYQGRIQLPPPQSNAVDWKMPLSTIGTFEVEAPWQIGHSEVKRIDFSSIQFK